MIVANLTTAMARRNKRRSARIYTDKGHGDNFGHFGRDHHGLERVGDGGNENGGKKRAIIKVDLFLSR
jgi:hypothetical protein